MIKLNVLYPQPLDVEQFEKDYAEHIQLLHEKTGIPLTERPYRVIRYFAPPGKTSPYYQMFSMPFESMEALQATLSSEGMQEVAADAFRISSGGAPVMLTGDED